MREAVLIKQKFIKTAAVCVPALFCMVYCLAFPRLAAKAAYDALLLCGRAVIPSLCLFIIAAKMTAKINIGEYIPHFYRLMKRIFILSDAGVTVVLTGFIAGFPTGAVTAAGLCAGGEMKREEASSLLPYSNNCSPAFLICTVGEKFFGDTKQGLFLLFAQTLSSLILLFISRGERKGITGNKKCVFKAFSPFKVIASSISEGGAAMIGICACIIFFSVLSEAVTGLASFAVPEGGTVSALISSSLEVTRGLSLFGAMKEKSPALSIALSGAAVGWAGLSVAFQVYGAALSGNISGRGYMTGKAVSSVLCAAFSLVFYFASCKNKQKEHILAMLFLCFVTISVWLAKKFYKKGRKISIYDI